jgi:DNA-binding NarL/FixJ family response regulator
MALPASFCERLARDCAWCLHILEKEVHLQRQKQVSSEEARKKVRALSGAQFTVLQLMVKGLSTRAIADSLHLSKRTIETHQRCIYQELDVHSQREATLIGLAAGLSTT